MILGVAIVGIGIGEQHLAGFHALPDHYRVRFLVDRDLGRARAAAARQELHDFAISPDLAPALADPAVDVVDICLPPHLHFEAASEALRAKKHVILEKPIAGSLAEVDALEALAGEAGRQLVPVFQYRFGRGLRRLLTLIGDGAVGRPFVTALETHWNRTAAYYHVPWRGWAATELGGAIVGHAIHAHDLVSLVHGPPVRVFARIATRVNPIETEDCAALSLEMADGTLLAHSITLGSAAEISRFRFCFEPLTAESNTAPYRPHAAPWQFCPRDETGAAALTRDSAGGIGESEGFAGLFQACHGQFVGAAERHPLAPTLLDGRRSIELATAIFASAESGCEVALPLARDHPFYAGWREGAGGTVTPLSSGPG
jgi:predicted dehydrogenase